MAQLTFGNIASASASVQAEVPKKVLCGIQTCQHVLAIEKDAQDLFSTIAQRSREIRRRTESIIPTITCPEGEMMGFLKAFESLTALMTALSSSAQAVSSTVEHEAAEPLAAVLGDLVKRKDGFLSRKVMTEQQIETPPQIVISPIHGAAPDDRKKRQKLQDRVLLANEEYQVEIAYSS